MDERMSRQAILNLSPVKYFSRGWSVRDLTMAIQSLREVPDAPRSECGAIQRGERQGITSRERRNLISFEFEYVVMIKITPYLYLPLYPPINPLCRTLILDSYNMHEIS